MQASLCLPPLSLEHSHQDTGCHSPAHMSHLSCVFVPSGQTGREHLWVTHLFVPLVCSHTVFVYFPHFIDSISEGELFFIPWWLTAAENPGSDSHWATEWAGTQSGNICDYESRFIYVDRKSVSHHFFKWNDMSNVIYHLHFSYIMYLHIVTNMSSFLLISAL